MGRSPYQSEKRRKELARLQKQEEKRQRRFAKRHATTETAADGTAGEQLAGGPADGTAGEQPASGAADGSAAGSGAVPGTDSPAEAQPDGSSGGEPPAS